MYTYIHKCMHTYIHTYIHAYVHTYIHPTFAQHSLVSICNNIVWCMISCNSVCLLSELPFPSHSWCHTAINDPFRPWVEEALLYMCVSWYHKVQLHVGGGEGAGGGGGEGRGRWGRGQGEVPCLHISSTLCGGMLPGQHIHTAMKLYVAWALKSFVHICSHLPSKEKEELFHSIVLLSTDATTLWWSPIGEMTSIVHCLHVRLHCKVCWTVCSW